MYRPDIVVVNDDSQPVVVVEVIAGKLKPYNKETGFYYYENAHEYMQKTRAQFLIIVSRKIIEIWEEGKKKPREEKLKTEEALKPYSGFSTLDTVTHDYIEALVDAWLNDLISHWKMKKPPYEGKLEKIGLLSLIKNGRVREQVSE